MTSEGFPRGSIHEAASLQTADRIALRQLVDSYAKCADRRDTAGQLALFTADSDYEVYGDPGSVEPTQRFRGWSALVPKFNSLRKYVLTTHFNGQSILVLNDDRACGTARCLVHMVAADGSARTLTITSIRYLDVFVKDGGGWRIRHRKEMVDWSESRVLSTIAGDRVAESGRWSTAVHRQRRTGDVGRRDRAGVRITLASPAHGR